MHFCPLCGNLLLIEAGHNSMQFCCATCHFISPITEIYTNPAKLPRHKLVDDVLGGEDAWENVDRTASKCVYCDGTEAYFFQIQIRSADEPMTTFYKCVKCKKQYNDR